MGTQYENIAVPKKKTIKSIGKNLFGFNKSMTRKPKLTVPI